MTKDEVYGIARNLLSFAGGFAASKGWIDADTAIAVAGAVATLIAAVWSVRSKRTN